ncbi:MAG: hypothetical protein FWH10_01580 [Oscillospiraceae bacterium]|nr:hypothetical protein [Oscillospiraceae bacterium]
MKKLTRKMKLELVMQYAKDTWEKSELHERQQYTFKVVSVSLIAPDTFRIVNGKPKVMLTAFVILHSVKK